MDMGAHVFNVNIPSSKPVDFACLQHVLLTSICVVPAELLNRCKFAFMTFGLVV